METVPVALTVRWISTGAPALSWVQDGRAGGGPAGRAPWARSRSRSMVVSREGRVLRCWPARLRCTVVVSIHKVSLRPARAGPNQNCWPQTPRLPLTGTIRSISTASMATAASSRVPPGWGGHVQGLVRTAGVVLDPPGIHRGLRGFQSVKGAVWVEQFALDALMPALDFPCCSGGSGFGQSLGDAVVSADPLKEHLGRARSPESAGGLFAVVAEHFLGNPVLGHRGQKRGAYRSGTGPRR